MARRFFRSAGGVHKQSPAHKQSLARMHAHSSSAPSSSNTPPTRPDSSSPTVVPLHSPLLRQRTTLCDALIDLADTWRALDVRDEPGWSVFAADAALSLTRYLIQHAAAVRGVAMVRDDPLCWTASGAGDESTGTVVGASADVADPALSGNMDAAIGASAAKAADAAVLAFLGVVDALSPTSAMSEIVDAAVALGVIDADGDTTTGLDVDYSPGDVLATGAPITRRLRADALVTVP